MLVLYKMGTETDWRCATPQKNKTSGHDKLKELKAHITNTERSLI